MKLTTIILLASALHVSASGWGQNVTLKYRDATVKRVFKDIMRQTGVSIVYKEAQISQLSRVSINLANTPVDQALKQCLQNQPIGFKVVNGTIIITALPAVTATAAPALTPPPRIVKGKVVDPNGLPIAGASVTIESSGKTVTTDAEGMFSIEAPDQTGKLVISHINYEIMELSFNSKTANLNITLALKENKLTDIVVVAYGSESKATQTSAVASVKSSEIINIPSAQLSTSLAGRLPGAQIVQNSGFVGSSASISVRGAKEAPLYVIDNVVTDKAQFDVLDPGEVESVSILKDAAAAAIYGARAAGGVIVVKTSSGKKGNVQVNYRGNVSASRTLQPLQNWTPEEELVYRNAVAKNANIASANPNPNFQVPFDEEALNYAKTIQPQSVNDILWRNPYSQQHSLNVSGGSDNVTYFFSGNYSKNKGSYDNTSFDKYTLRAKVDAKVSKNLKIGTNLSYNRRYTNRFYWPYDRDNGEGFTVADFYRPTFNLSRLYPFYAKADGTPTTANDPNGFPTIQPGWGFNPAEIVNSVNYRNILYNTFNAIVTAELDIPQVKGLSLRFLGDYRQDAFLRKDFIGEFNKSYRVQTKGTSGIGLLQLAPLKFDAQNTVVNSYRKSYTSIDQNTYLDERYQTNFFIDYSRSFDLHRVNSFVGVEQYQFRRKAMEGTAQALLTPSVDQILAANAAAERRYFDGSELNQARLSYFGRVKYDYDAKYIAEFSFRQDGSYIFRKQFGFFPSVSAGWLVSREGFFKLKPVSTLKLRASYGTTGYDGVEGTVTNIDPFQFQSNYNIVSNFVGVANSTENGGYVFGNSNLAGLAPPNVVANPNITWAINKTFNLGVDMGLFDDALSFSFDYFNTRRSRILANRAAAIPGTFGSGLPEENIGEQKVKGVEFAIGYTKNKGDFGYSVGFNLGYAIDEYVSWPQAENIPAFKNLIGRPTSGVVTGYISKGVVKDQGKIDALPAGYTQFNREVQLGYVLLEDINGDGYTPGLDGKVDENDQTVISKNAVPRVNFGAPVDVRWKNIALSLFFQGVGKYDKFLQTLNTRITPGGTGAGGVFQLADRPYFELWTDAYDPQLNPGGKYPAATGSWVDPDRSGSSTTFWIRNGAYVRLKNVNLAYSVPQKWISRIGLRGLQANVNATNLLTLSAFKEYDPEQESLDSYPVFRTYSFGLNVSL